MPTNATPVLTNMEILYHTPKKGKVTTFKVKETKTQMKNMTLKQIMKNENGEKLFNQYKNMFQRKTGTNLLQQKNIKLCQKSKNNVALCRNNTSRKSKKDVKVVRMTPPKPKSNKTKKSSPRPRTADYSDFIKLRRKLERSNMNTNTNSHSRTVDQSDFKKLRRELGLNNINSKTNRNSVKKRLTYNNEPSNEYFDANSSLSFDRTPSPVSKGVNNNLSRRRTMNSLPYSPISKRTRSQSRPIANRTRSKMRR